MDAYVKDQINSHKPATQHEADLFNRWKSNPLGEGIVSLRPDGTIEYCNEQLSEYLKIKTEEIIGSLFTKYIPAVEHNTLINLLSATGKDAVSGGFHLTPLTGPLLPVQVVIHQIISNDQNHIYLGLQIYHS